MLSSIVQKLAADLDVEIELVSNIHNDDLVMTVTKNGSHDYKAVYNIDKKKIYTETEIVEIIMGMVEAITKREKYDRIAYNEIKDVLQKSLINNSKNDMEENNN